VRQLARLSEAGVERLARLPRAFVSLVPIRLEQVSAAVGEHHCAIVRAERGGPYEPLPLEVSQALAGVPAAVVEIALGNDAKGADGGKHPAFGAADLVDAVALSHRPAVTTPWQVEIPCEHFPLIALVIALAFACAASTAEVSVTYVVAIAIIISDIVPVPHFRLDFRRLEFGDARAPCCFGEYGHPRKSVATNLWVTSVDVGCCRPAPMFSSINPTCGIVEGGHARAEYRIDRGASPGVERDLASEHNHSGGIRPG
jgi:hypothetical protein